MIAAINDYLNLNSFAGPYGKGLSLFVDGKVTMSEFNPTTCLNLTAADYVFLVDPWWNPAVENQAIDRCYRIGQDKKVFAYRMICKDTVEEKIVQYQQKKQAVAADIIQADESFMRQLSVEDIKGLFD